MSIDSSLLEFWREFSRAVLTIVSRAQRDLAAAAYEKKCSNGSKCHN
jgi:hypothetical protein